MTARSEGIRDLQPQLGELIARYRNQRSLSQDALAEIAGIDVRTLGRVEAGRSYQGGKLGAICTALGLELGDVQQAAYDLRRAAAASTAALPKASRSTAAIAAIGADLDSIDRRIATAHGNVLAPTRAEGEVGFSSRRLVSSLAGLGIPLDVILLVVGQLPDLLEHVISPGDPFTTAHIRSAVARAISGLSPALVQSTDSFKVRENVAQRSADVEAMVDEVKFDWASRYARRYGNPEQIIQVLDRDGQTYKLDFHFLKTELIPHALRRLLDEDMTPGMSPLITNSVISEMAQSALEEFRRLGLYTVRYRTALHLLEDLALHPPHPWMVTLETRSATVAYDLERAHASLDHLESGGAKDPYDISHRYSETVHHLCSAALALYGGFLGHRETSSIHLLRHWLHIEDQNVVLWETCDLHFLTGDLEAIGVAKPFLEGLLKRLDTLHHAARHKPAGELALAARRLTDIVEKLVGQRAESLLLKTKLQEGGSLTEVEFAALARHVLSSHLAARKIGDLVEKDHGARIGLKVHLKFDDTALQKIGPLTVVILCLSPDDAEARREAILDLLDQVAAHRAAEAGLILTPTRVAPQFRAELAAMMRESDAILALASIPEITERAKVLNGPSDLIDEIFEQG